MPPLPPVYLVINNNLFYILSTLLNKTIQRRQAFFESSHTRQYTNVISVGFFFHFLSLFVSFSAEGSRKRRSRKGKEKYTVRNSMIGSMSFGRLDIISI